MIRKINLNRENNKIDEIWKWMNHLLYLLCKIINMPQNYLKLTVQIKQINKEQVNP